MPELPEIEHLRRTLAPRIIGRSIGRVRVLRRDMVVAPGDPEGGFSRARKAPKRRVRTELLLAGTAVAELLRHGKQLAIVGEGGPTVCIHLGMSGQLLHLPPGTTPARPGHVHVRWELDDGAALVFRDPRRFGGIWAYPDPEAMHRSRWGRLGPDALSIRGDTLHRLLRGARPVKAALMDQELVAGVGNIYADEALHAAGIHPRRPAGSLDRPDAVRLARAIRNNLSTAVATGGSTIRDYLDAEGNSGRTQLTHAVYGRGGLGCPRCGQTLEAAQVAQRTTVWCPRCQR